VRARQALKREIGYAVADSEIAIPYTEIVEDKGQILVTLPVGEGFAKVSGKLRFTVKPVPRADKQPPEEPPLRVVPDVVRMPATRAFTALINAGFDIGTIAYDPSAKSPRGVVIKQKPEGKSSAMVGTPVDLTISGESIKAGGTPVEIEISPEDVKLRSETKSEKDSKKTSHR